MMTTRFLRATVAVCFALVGAASLEAKTLRMGVMLLPQTQAAPFTALNLPSSMPHLALFDTLTVMGRDGTIQPSLAVKWVAETPTRWVITLRENVVFSNGEPLTSDAFVTAIDYLLTPEGRVESVGSQLANYTVTSAKARDALTFEINTAEPDAVLPLHLMFLRGIAPGAWRKQGPQGFASNPVGTGPYVLERWGAGKVELRANTTSWRVPKIENLEIIQIADQAARVQALTSDAIDVAYGITPDERETVESVGGTFVVYPTPETLFLAFVTMKDSPVKDARVRRALNYAVNKQNIIQNILGGATTPASQFSNAMAFGYNPDLKPYEYDPAKAKKLLAEAGFKDGFHLPALLVGNFNNTDSVYQQVASDLANVGVTLELRRATFAKYMEYMYQGGWPSLAFGMNSNGYDPLNAYRIRSCSWTHPYHCDEALMPLIQAARSATDPEQRRLLTQKVLAAERDNPPGILLWQNPYFDGVSKRVIGYSATEEQIPFHMMDLIDEN